MSIQSWTFVFVGLSFSLYLFIAWRSRVADTKGFYVAGRGVPALANGMAVGLGYGANSQASLITRGLAEMSRLGVALGAVRQRVGQRHEPSQTLMVVRMLAGHLLEGSVDLVGTLAAGSEERDENMKRI